MKIVDLSMEIYSGMEVYEGDPEVEIVRVHTYEKNSWELRKLSMGSHTGTHVDAFSHMDEEGDDLGKISLERFFGQAQLVELDEHWPRGMGLFFIEEIGTDYLDKILEAEPGFVGGNIGEKMERALLKNGIITYTNLVNLDKLPFGKTFTFYGLPLNIRHGDGSPVRAIAILD